MLDLPPSLPSLKPERAARTGFAANQLDRLSARRDDADHVARLRHHPGARCVVFVTERPMLRRRAALHDPFFTFDEVAGFGHLREVALLGQDSERPVFAALLDDAAVIVSAPADDGSFIDQKTIAVPGHDDIAVLDMRAVAMGGLVDAPGLGILAQAKSLTFWHARHRFCANCGAPTRVAAAGWRRDCEACGVHHFPRTDPVVIMLAIHGDDCLLGRQRRFPQGMYSALAGFIEAGETIEDAVRREIAEEAGIATAAVQYLASQPWPFPASLMIGCLVQASERDLTVDTVELEDARWFSRHDAVAMLEQRHPEGFSCPPPTAIAHTLMRAWALEGETAA